jgi:phage tail-like protein
MAETINHYYPLTKMNFLVTVGSTGGEAAFSEVTGIDSTVDVIEFRQGNAASLAPIKIPGLVKHGNVTLKYGITKDSTFKTWVMNCVNEVRKPSSDAARGFKREDLVIELMDITDGSPDKIHTTKVTGALMWVLKKAWVTKYTGPDLNASTSEVAMESVEIAYEELTIPNTAGAAT